MQEATQYILANEAGRTDVWICSDLRQSDWNPGGGRWESVREQLRDRDGVKTRQMAELHGKLLYATEFGSLHEGFSNSVGCRG